MNTGQGRQQRPDQASDSIDHTEMIGTKPPRPSLSPTMKKQIKFNESKFGVFILQDFLCKQARS